MKLSKTKSKVTANFILLLFIQITVSRFDTCFSSTWKLVVSLSVGRHLRCGWCRQMTPPDLRCRVQIEFHAVGVTLFADDDEANQVTVTALYRGKLPGNRVGVSCQHVFKFIRPKIWRSKMICAFCFSRDSWQCGIPTPDFCAFV